MMNQCIMAGQQNHILEASSKKGDLEMGKGKQSRELIGLDLRYKGFQPTFHLTRTYPSHSKQT